VLVRRKWPDMYCVYPHRLRTARDWAKLAHCVVAVLYQPALAAARMSGPICRVVSYPLLVTHHLAWKVGMARQAVVWRGFNSMPPAEGMAAERHVVHRWRRLAVQQRGDSVASTTERV
jgi:hypothetical protein